MWRVFILIVCWAVSIMLSEPPDQLRDRMDFPLRASCCGVCATFVVFRRVKPLQTPLDPWLQEASPPFSWTFLLPAINFTPDSPICSCFLRLFFFVCFTDVARKVCCFHNLAYRAINQRRCHAPKPPYALSFKRKLVSREIKSGFKRPM